MDQWINCKDIYELLSMLVIDIDVNWEVQWYKINKINICNFSNFLFFEDSREI